MEDEDGGGVLSWIEDKIFKLLHGKVTLGCSVIGGYRKLIPSGIST